MAAWQPILLVFCTVATCLLGWVTLLRSRKADDVLDVAANIQATYQAQSGINDDLREDVTRLRQQLIDCEANHVADRASIEAAQDIVLEQARRIAHLKATVDEHEHTIARHERTINQLRVGTEADRREA